MELSELIEIASQGYGHDKTVINEVHEGTYDGGDTLAKFIEIELRQTYEENASDEDQLHRALQVMETAQKELDGVVSALRKERNEHLCDPDLWVLIVHEAKKQSYGRKFDPLKNKIALIKAYRTLKHVTLKEAKTFVERMIEEQGGT